MSSVYTDPYQHSYPPGILVKPVLTTIAPSTGVMGQSITVDLSGTGFNASTKGYVDGVEKPTVLVSPSLVRVTFTPAAAGTVQITARNGMQVTAQKAFTVTVSQARGTEPPKASTKAPKGRD